MGLKVRFGVLLLVIAAVAAYLFYTPLRLTYLYVMGRNKGCPYSQAVRSAANMNRQAELDDKIFRASRLVAKDSSGYHLWDTPAGSYWIPQGSDYTLPFNLAEQARKIYGTGERAVRTRDVVLDCGANVGVFVREALAAGAQQGGRNRAGAREYRVPAPQFSGGDRRRAA